MTDWSTAPPSAEMDAAMAEQVMGWKVVADTEYHNLGGAMVAINPDGEKIFLWHLQEHVYSGEQGWQPSRGDLAAAFQVMAARGDKWTWGMIDFTKVGQTDIQLMTKYGLPISKATVAWDEPGIDGDRARAFCLAVCRCAMLAAKERSND